MEEHTKKSEQPQPCEAFGHPFTKMVMHDVSNHSPGFEESLPLVPSKAMKSEEITAELPPRNPDKVPREGLAERIIQRFAEQEKKK